MKAYSSRTLVALFLLLTSIIVLSQEIDEAATQNLDYEGIPAIIPEVQGTAHVTGVHTFLIDPKDELRDGFILGS